LTFQITEFQKFFQRDLMLVSSDPSQNGMTGAVLRVACRYRE